ncbi:MAG: hypothetical protein V8S74_01010 [Lachnospirales bacterium]
MGGSLSVKCIFSYAYCCYEWVICRGDHIAPKDLSANPKDLFLQSKNADGRPW